MFNRPGIKLLSIVLVLVCFVYFIDFNFFEFSSSLCNNNKGPKLPPCYSNLIPAHLAGEYSIELQNIIRKEFLGTIIQENHIFLDPKQLDFICPFVTQKFVNGSYDILTQIKVYYNIIDLRKYHGYIDLIVRELNYIKSFA